MYTQIIITYNISKRVLLNLLNQVNILQIKNNISIIMKWNLI